MLAIALDKAVPGVEGGSVDAIEDPRGVDEVAESVAGADELGDDRVVLL